MSIFIGANNRYLNFIINFKDKLDLSEFFWNEIVKIDVCIVKSDFMFKRIS
jgi:hypothetical protein